MSKKTGVNVFMGCLRNLKGDGYSELWVWEYQRSLKISSCATVFDVRERAEINPDLIISMKGKKPRFFLSAKGCIWGLYPADFLMRLRSSLTFCCLDTDNEIEIIKILIEEKCGKEIDWSRSGLPVIPMVDDYKQPSYDEDAMWDPFADD